MILLFYFLHQLFVIPEKSGIQRGKGIPNQVGNDISIFGSDLARPVGAYPCCGFTFSISSLFQIPFKASYT